MKGSATHHATTTTVTPVHTTQVRNAEVVQASASSIIVRGAKGFQMYTEGDVEKRGIKVYKNGRPVTFSDLHAGDKLTATIVTEGPPKVVTQREVQARLASPPPPPATAAATAPSSATAAAPSSAEQRADIHRRPQGNGTLWLIVGGLAAAVLALVVITGSRATARLVVAHSTETRAALSAPMRPARTVLAAIVLSLLVRPGGRSGQPRGCECAGGPLGNRSGAAAFLEKLTVTLQVPAELARTYFCRCARSRRHRLRAPARGERRSDHRRRPDRPRAAIWGKGMFKIPHSIKVDPDGNVWTTDASDRLVAKFTPAGRKLHGHCVARHLWGRTVAFLPPPSTISSMRVRDDRHHLSVRRPDCS